MGCAARAAGDARLPLEYDTLVARKDLPNGTEQITCVRDVPGTGRRAVLVAVAVWILPALAGAQQEYQLQPPDPGPPVYQEGDVVQFWTMPPEVGQSTNAYGREQAWNVDTWLWPSLLSPNVSFT